MALSEDEEFELLSLERQKSASVPKTRINPPPVEQIAAKELAPADTADLIAANPVTRFFTGAAAPILGASQIAEEALFGTQGGRERAKQLEEMQKRGNEAVPMGPSGAVADFTGSVLSPAFLSIAKGMNLPASFLERLGQGAGFGALAGATSPQTEQDASRLPATAGGTAVGTAIPLAAPAITTAGKAIYHAAIEPWMNSAAIKGRAFLEAAGDKAEEIIKLLKEGKEIVPGSRPTSGQAAAPAGSAEFSALQKSAERVKPSEYVARDDQQNAARVNELDKLGTPKSAEQLRRRRDLQASMEYGVANNQLVKADGILKEIFQRPSMDKALARAEELAQEKGTPFIIGKDAPERVTQSAILNERGQPAYSTVMSPTSAYYPVSTLHTVKMALDDMVKNPERFGIGANEARAIKDTQRVFTSWVENKVPDYATARRHYAEASKPINQADIGEYLHNRLTQALGEEGKQRAGVYAQALRDAPGTIKRATGEPRYDELTKILTPEQQTAVNSIRDDLARGARYETLASKGQGTTSAQDVASASMEKEAGGRLPNMLHRGMMVTNAIIARLEGKVNKRLAAEIAVEMLNPPGVAKSMAEEQMRQTKNAVIVKAIQGLQNPVTGGAIQELPQQKQRQSDIPQGLTGVRG